MKKVLILLVAVAAIAAVKVQNTVNGKLTNGSVVEIINSKGELVYGNTTAAEIALTIKSFDIVFPIGKVEATISTEKGKNTLAKSDIDALNANKGVRAIVKNIVAVDNTGKETKLPEIQFFIQ